MHRLIDREPRASAEEILDAFSPSARFANVRFSNYQPDAAHPSQAAALLAVQQFLQPVTTKTHFWQRTSSPATPPGIYLDGGFGVGKTHLLTALWHEFSGTKLIASFAQYTSLVGALGFREAVTRLSTYELICIDEFELDDPGDTVLMSTLLNELVSSGVRLAATSNTLPDRLGEGRFAADDFMREIQGLAAHFSVVRIDGPDYRHRENLQPRVFSDEELTSRSGLANESVDEFVDLIRHLGKLHPSSYHLLISGLARVNFVGAKQLTDQVGALRFVTLVDRLYDAMCPVGISGVKADEIFGGEILRGGYRKKYLRAISRLSALTNEV